MESRLLQGGAEGMNGVPKISVAVPVYNEESIVEELLRRVLTVLDSLPGGPHEIVLADDGSSDRTWSMIEQAAARDPRVVGVSLSRNFGHQAAIGAALDHVTGDYIVVMDGDLQDPPEVISELLAEAQKGFDVVYVIRIKRKESMMLRVCYAVYYRLIASLADLDLPVGAGDFAILSRRVCDLIRQSPERQRYLRGLRTWYGFRQKGLEIERDARHSGNSKYSLRRLVRLALDGVFAFSVLPIRLATALGAFVVACSALFAFYSLIVKVFLGHSPEGFTALILAITFLSGVQLLFLGVIGEYIGRIYEEVKQRPHYVVKQVVRKTNSGS
ncbi:MAG: glycosyltransferase family 2 protein [Pirellula sp.]